MTIFLAIMALKMVFYFGGIMEFINRFIYSGDDAEEIWTKVINQKYWVIPLRTAYFLFAVIICALVALKVYSTSYLITLLIESVVLFIFETIKNKKIEKVVCSSKHLNGSEFEIDLFEECMILIVDSIDVPIRWDNVDFVVESKNYYCIRLNYGGVIPIHKNGFTQDVDLKMFEEFLFDKTKRKSRI